MLTISGNVYGVRTFSSSLIISGISSGISLTSLTSSITSWPQPPTDTELVTQIEPLFSTNLLHERELSYVINDDILSHCM